MDSLIEFLGEPISFASSIERIVDAARTISTMANIERFEAPRFVKAQADKQKSAGSQVPDKTTVSCSKYIVQLDLSRYSDICAVVEQNLGSSATLEINSQIERLIDASLRPLSLDLAAVLISSSGDGALLAFDGVGVALRFAEELLRASETHNLRKSVELAQRHFRIGICVGEISPFNSGSMGRAAGMAIANAVRLEAAAKTGQVLISSDAWADLDAVERSRFDGEEVVAGKRNEAFRVHRRQVVPLAPWERT